MFIWNIRDFYFTMKPLFRKQSVQLKKSQFFNRKINIFKSSKVWFVVTVFVAFGFVTNCQVVFLDMSLAASSVAFSFSKDICLLMITCSLALISRQSSPACSTKLAPAEPADFWRWWSCTDRIGHVRTFHCVHRLLFSSRCHLVVSLFANFKKSFSCFLWITHSEKW